MRKIGVFVFLILSFLMTLYYYYYFKPHVFYSSQQNSLKSKDGITDTFTLSGTCKAVNYDTFVPYVIVKVNSFEVLSIAVNNGYDTLHDCLASVTRIQFVEEEAKVQIFMQSGQKKEILLINNKGGR
jgi:hypothetical protein